MSHINCEICGAKTHSIKLHLDQAHPGVSLEDYKLKYPDAPVLSELAKQKIAEKRAAMAAAPAATGVAAAPAGDPASASASRQPLHQVFGFSSDNPEARNARGGEIPVSVYNPADPSLVPDIDANYVFDLSTLKNALMAFELNINLYVWGHTGCGKTTMLEQICARTRRPMLRVQHTINTEEAHIVGQWTAKDGSTEFELGPLAVAMKEGLVYLADEYDFALPSVLSVYQPVLEGKPLVIKEADAANRIIRPHPNFRFVATGNTNGSGDETGLYQGTQLQNAANYDRFNMVLEVKYMPESLESEVVHKQAGVALKDAQKLVSFANQIREAYASNKLSSPLSPRTIIAIAKIGMMKGDYRAGISLAFTNKLSRVDKETADGIAQREFG